MLYITYEEVSKIVEGYVEITPKDEFLAGDVPQPNIRIRTVSGIQSYQLESREAIPMDIRLDFLEHAQEYCFYPETQTFKYRPRLEVSAPDVSVNMTIEGVARVPVGTEVNIDVRYIDPDGVGFKDLFTEVYVKDLTGNFELPSVTLENDQAQLTITSDWPTKMTLVARDSQALCISPPLELQFYKPAQ